MREPWFIRYWTWIAKIAGLVGWLLPGWGTVKVAFAGFPLQVLAFCAALTLAIGLWVTNEVLRLGDYLDKHFGYRALGTSFADLLEERVRIGDSAWTANDLANILAGRLTGPDDPQEKWNRVFRWIKHSVINGQVKGQYPDTGGVNRETVIKLRDLAAFFRRPDWIEHVDVPEGFYDGTVRKL